MYHSWEMFTLEKVSVEKMGHTKKLCYCSKKWVTINKCFTLGKIGHTSTNVSLLKKCFTFKKCFTLGKMDHTYKNVF